MVGVSYHELAAGQKKQPRHTAGERKQFLTVCVLGAAFLFNAFINAGLFESVDIKDDGIFPGGLFVHRLSEHADYATTGGYWRETREHLLDDKNGDDSAFDDDLYAVYIDMVSGYNGIGRFFAGILIDDSKAHMKQKLLEENMKFKKTETPYEVGDLPSVRAATVTFPWTDGFVSALLHNYKVFPALFNYSKENFPKDYKFIVSVSCNRKKKMCTHYIPMIEPEKFLLGQPDTKDYSGFEDDQVSLEKALDKELLMKGFQKLTGFGKKE